MGYINKLENYDAGEIAKIATDHDLYEEALTIYKKYDQHAMAINVLVEHIVSIDRGLDYANKVNKPEVWSRLAKAQLDGLILSVHDDSLWPMILSSHLFFRTCTSKRKARQIWPKSSKFRVMLASLTTSFTSFKRLTNLFWGREATFGAEKRHACEDQPFA